MVVPQIVLISGCSTGIGFYTALLLAKDAQRSYRVYATMRNLDKRTALEEQGRDQLGDTLIIKRMDVSSDESVNSLVQEIFTKEGKIDVLSKSLILISNLFISVLIFYNMPGWPGRILLDSSLQFLQDSLLILSYASSIFVS